MTQFKQEVIKLDLKDLKAESANRKKKDWRYVQTLAVKVDKGADLIYSFMKDGKLDNLKIEAVTDKDKVPSITDDFIEAFVWENEIHDLFGINFEGIAIDFKGNFYATATDKPFTVISPEVLQRREKQAKIDAAMAAKAAKDKKAAPKKDGAAEGKGE